MSVFAQRAYIRRSCSINLRSVRIQFEWNDASELFCWLTVQFLGSLLFLFVKISFVCAGLNWRTPEPTARASNGTATTGRQRSSTLQRWTHDDRQQRWCHHTLAHCSDGRSTTDSSSIHRGHADLTASSPVGRRQPLFDSVRLADSCRRRFVHQHTDPHQRSTLHSTALHTGAGDDATAATNAGVRCAGPSRQPQFFEVQPLSGPSWAFACRQNGSARPPLDRTIRFVQSARTRRGPGARERAFHSGCRPRTGCHSGAHC